MQKFKLVIVDCWIEKGPDGFPRQRFKDQSQIREVAASDADMVRREIRKKLRAEGKAVRQIAFATDGTIRATIWRDGRPEATPDKHMVWKRPPSSVPKRL